MFSQPFFYFVEHFVRKKVFPASAGRAGGLTFRICFRSLYVIVVCFVAICLPFFGDFVGLVSREAAGVAWGWRGALPRARP